MGAQLEIDVEIRKRLIGKSIHYADDTYLEVDLKEPFLRLHRVLRLKTEKNNNRVPTLEKAMDLILKTLRKMCIRELQSEGYGEGLKILMDYTKLSHKGVLEKYSEEA